MELVTGHAGTLHITAKQVSRLLRGVTATDESTVQRLNVGNNAAITYSGITMSIASGELLLDGYHVTLVDDTGGASGETLIFDATLESTNSRIDKVVLEIVQDNTTSYQRAEIVIVQGEESDSPVAPATPTEPESSTEEFLAVGVIAQVTITGDDISSLSDLTNLYGGSYLDLETFNEYVSEISTVNVKNLLPYPYTDTTKTVNGITFTDNGDGTITANGTATDTATFTLGTTSEYLDYDKSYILNGCPVNGSEGTYYIQTDVSNWIDTGSGVEFMRDLSMAGASIVIAEGTTVSNLTFSPMIRLAVIEDDTYEPYAMTNQELTERVQDIESDISETQDIVSDAWNSSKTYAADEYCISGNKLYKCLVANTGTQPPNTTYWEETTCAEELSELNSNLTKLNTYSCIECTRSWLGEWTTFGTETNTFYDFTVPYTGKYKLHSSLVFNINNTSSNEVTLQYINVTTSERIYLKQVTSYGNSRHSIDMDCIVELNADDLIYLQFQSSVSQSIRWLQFNKCGDYWQYLG